MGRINVLSEKTVNQIAAGEVIERPASVVKELIENSLDAGADEISVDVEEGGQKRIKVKDNGCGMTREEVKLAFQKHATSKIEDIEDLDDLSSLGFRGEALPSIAAVSKVTALTKSEDQLEGTKIVLDGGDVEKIEETGCAVGTSIEVKDLFYNTPARKKYLKKKNTELAHISEVVTRNAIANPEVEFSLTHNENELTFIPKSRSMLENIKSIYGKEVAKKMIEVEKELEDFSLKGYVSKPEITRSNRKHIFTYVNSRYVKNNVLKNGIVDGFETLLKKGRYPLAFLDIDIDPAKIDVNVHPTKTKIRFLEAEKVRERIAEAVNDSLLKKDLIPDRSTESEVERSGEISEERDRTIDGEKSKGEQTKLEMDEKREIEKSKLSHMSVLGILKDSYIVVETPSGMAIVDQHAAHERINYENLKDKLEDDIDSQKLVSPKTVELKPKEAALLRANEELLERLGFDIDYFGKTTFRLRGVPVIFGEVQEKEILHSVLDELSEWKSNSLEERREEMIKYMACHDSVTAGDKLSITSAKELLERLGKVENPYTCPHGRPTIVSFAEKEIEKWFKRT
ncbi:MAG: DNA mismatch repair endonuclease MutL [Candidatus Thermoplasmatota archaeon]|nr:DNA mismatch repair endonuclease MutL [Candidatus Thermoplasmatota archaeon]MBS3789464.1 DNA mismatch repair endonuclease MutL [Candidatus Thermoplasmatota archaeon]